MTHAHQRQRPTNMADIVANQQTSASKRPWAESLAADIGSENQPEDGKDLHKEYQAKRSRSMPDGETQMDDYEISNGSLPSCYESGSDSTEKSVRSDGLFHEHITSNGGRTIEIKLFGYILFTL